MEKEQKTATLILTVMALGAILIHILLNGQYGFHRDELDFIMNARRLDWGYISYPPVVPINTPLWEFTTGVTDDLFTEMVGWQDLTAQVAEIYQSLPETEKPRTVILAGNYGEAGALELYGKEYGLPQTISGANSMWTRGYGAFEPETVIVVGFESAYAKRFFKTRQYSGRVTNRYGVQNEESTRHTGLFVCRGPHRPWQVMWQEMQWYQ
jgi:hypothetical protein